MHVRCAHLFVMELENFPPSISSISCSSSSSKIYSSFLQSLSLHLLSVVVIVKKKLITSSSNKRHILPGRILAVCISCCDSYHNGRGKHIFGLTHANQERAHVHNCPLIWRLCKSDLGVPRSSDWAEDLATLVAQFLFGISPKASAVPNSSNLSAQAKLSKLWSVSHVSSLICIKFISMHCVKRHGKQVWKFKNAKESLQNVLKRDRVNELFVLNLEELQWTCQASSAPTPKLCRSQKHVAQCIRVQWVQLLKLLGKSE